MMTVNEVSKLTEQQYLLQALQSCIVIQPIACFGIFRRMQ